MVILASEFDRSKYMKAVDTKTEKKFRIKSVTAEEIGTNKERKLIVWFANDDRGLVLNKTTNRVLRGAFGDDVSGWANKVVVLFPTTDNLRGQMVPAIRVRIPPPKQAAAGNGSATATKAAEPPPPEMPANAVEPADNELDDELNF
jgi:hypothetical protein